MQLDFIDNLNGFGDNVVRLYDFNKAEAIKFRDTLRTFLSTNTPVLDLGSLDYIEERNCKLSLAIADEDLGVITRDKENFYCAMTAKGFEGILELLTPFCEKETKGYKMLYDVDSQTDFLFSPAGTW
tara:strand:- start:1042 stop:1422 length:381 start_codon:yes stop_codon:yes gene_type:complete